MSLHIETIRLEWGEDGAAPTEAANVAATAGQVEGHAEYWDRLESTDDEVATAVREWLDIVADSDD